MVACQRDTGQMKEIPMAQAGKKHAYEDKHLFYGRDSVQINNMTSN